MHGVILKIQSQLGRYNPREGSARNVSTLTGGTAIGQAVVFLVSPLLTRLYSPLEFGTLAVYSAIVGIIGGIAAFRYELAIPLTRTSGAAVNVLMLSLACVFAVTVASSGLIVFFGSEIASLLNTPELSPFLWLLPIGIFFSGTYQCLNFWAVREKQFGRIAATKIQQGFAVSAVQAGTGFLQGGVFGLLVGPVVGQAAGVLVLAQGARGKKEGIFRHISNRRISLLARRYNRFPKYSALSSLANSTSTLAPMILFSVLISPLTAGIFMLAHRALQTPLGLVGRSIGQVFHGRAAEARSDGSLKILTFSAFSKLLGLGMGPLVAFGVIAPEFFSLIFGEQWRQAGVYAQWMVPWMILQFVFSPISTLVSVSERQIGGLIWQSSFAIIRIGAIFLGVIIGGGDIAFKSYAIASMLCYLGFGIWLLDQEGVGGKAVFKTIFGEVLFVLPFLVSLFLIKHFVENGIYLVLIGTGIIASLVHVNIVRKNHIQRT